VEAFCYKKKKAPKAQTHHSSQGNDGSSTGGSEWSSAGSETQELLMLLHRLTTSMLSGAVGSVTRSSALTGSTTTSQSFTLRLPSSPSPGAYTRHLNYGASFYMTPHSAHLSSLRPSYHHCIVHIADESPLFVAEQCTLFSDSFYVPHVSLVPDLTMHLMSVGQITNHDCHVILDPNVCCIPDRRTGHLVDTGPYRCDS
jgi:hypothetical protein